MCSYAGLQEQKGIEKEVKDARSVNCADLQECIYVAIVRSDPRCVASPSENCFREVNPFRQWLISNRRAWHLARNRMSPGLRRRDASY